MIEKVILPLTVKLRIASSPFPNMFLGTHLIMPPWYCRVSDITYIPS